MIGKIHNFKNNKIFASCDKELLGKKIITKDFEIYFSKSFYGENKVTIDEVIKNIKECSSSNIFGKKICSLLIKKKIIMEETIIYIEDVPHVQIYNI